MVVTARRQAPEEEEGTQALQTGLVQLQVLAQG